MYNLLISFALLLVVTLGLAFGAKVNFWIAAFVGLAVFSGVFVLLARHIFKKISALMEVAQRDIQAGRLDKAVKTMETGFKYAPWQLFIKEQLNAQIGTVLYLKRDFAAAFEYLQKSFVRHWMAQGMLAICYMKRNKPGKMIEIFDRATSASRKEPLLWNLYAWCLEHVGEKDKAIAVLEKGIKKTGGDEHLQANLEALREGKKMKMRVYGDMWYQFHLEKPGALIRQQQKAIQGRRKIVRQ
jgi:tetratricopeptide (TPR) repeat protein